MGQYKSRDGTCMAQCDYHSPPHPCGVHTTEKYGRKSESGQGTHFVSDKANFYE